MNKIIRLFFLSLILNVVGCYPKNTSNRIICSNLKSVQISYELSNGRKVDTTITDPNFLREYSLKFEEIKLVDKHDFSAKSYYFLMVINMNCDEGTKNGFIYFTRYSGVFIDMDYQNYKCNQIAHYLLTSLNITIETNIISGN
jgi:hypothetical protein